MTPPSPGFRAVFRVRGMQDPGFLSRIVELFAQRGLSPKSVSMRGVLEKATLRLSVEGLDEDSAAVIAEKLGSMVLVETVDVEFRTSVGAATNPRTHGSSATLTAGP